jgi:hypothetical protein
MMGLDSGEYPKLPPGPWPPFINRAVRSGKRLTMAAMLDRIKNPDMLAQGILLDCRLGSIELSWRDRARCAIMITRIWGLENQQLSS